jgi:hypothetical protein
MPRELDIKINYKDHLLALQFNRFKYDNTISITLIKEDGEPFSLITTCIKRSGIDKNKEILFYLPDNEGLIEILVEHKVLELTGRTVYMVFVRSPVCRLLMKPKGFEDVKT